MIKLILSTLLINLALASDGEVIFKNFCMRCHTEKDKKPLSYLKAKSLLGWEPKVSLEEGIKRTVEWTLENWSWIKDVRL